MATVAAIVAVAVGVAALIGVHGNFPLSDDWAYAYATRGLCESGELRFLPWTGASLVFQAWYGALLCQLFGFSFTVLRVSTFVLGVLGVVGFYLLLRRLGVAQAAAVLAAAVLGLDPLYLNLSFTYMTDVPFTALAVWAAYLYVCGLDRGQRRLLLAAGALCAAATLVRQHGLLIAGAAAAAAALVPRRPHECGVDAASPRPGTGRPDDAGESPSLRERALDAAACLAPSVLALALLHAWLGYGHGMPAGMQNKIAEAVGAGVLPMANVAFRAFEYLGLLALPIAVALPDSPSLLRRRTALLTLAVALALAVFLYLREHALMFYLTNIMGGFTLGAITLRDVLFLGEPLSPQLSLVSRVGLTLAASAGWALLAGPWLDVLRERRSAAETFTVFALLALLAGSFLQAHYYFDRYLTPILPFAIAAALVARPRPRVHAGCWLLAAVLAVYAVAGTHDYMAWNRARYGGLEALERHGVDAREIDGGMDYNGWRLAAKLGDWPSDAEARSGQPATRKSWWWVVDDRYVASFRPLPGYRPKLIMPYDRWLPPESGAVLILEREREESAR